MAAHRLYAMSASTMKKTYSRSRMIDATNTYTTKRGAIQANILSTNTGGIAEAHVKVVNLEDENREV